MGVKLNERIRWCGGDVKIRGDLNGEAIGIFISNAAFMSASKSAYLKD
jgi:hypothetical protein